MKDIRSEIAERLEDASKRRADLANQIKALETEVETLKRMMDIENQRHGDQGSPFRKRVHLIPRSISEGTETAPDFIEGLLKTGPHSKNKLKEAGIQKGIFDRETAGRSIHITLVNMLRGNRIRELADGLYGLPEDRSPQRSDPPGAT